VVGSLNSCSASASVTLTEPLALEVNTAVSPAVCTANNGEISTQVSGGTAPYTYAWSNGPTTPAINNLPTGNYTLKVTDANACSFTTPLLVLPRIQETIHISLGNDTFFCPGARLTVSPGNFKNYLWQDNSTASSFTITSTGTFSVVVTNESGCTGMASIKVTVDCSDVYFPSGITPNGDTRNDLFGPLGNTGALRNYTLAVYDRFGERAFYTTDPFKKWDGRYKGSEYNSGSFVWIASYTLNGKAYTKKGSLMLIR
jgi:gliding motility-associated-like protein